MPLKDFQELVKDRPELLKEVNDTFELAGATQKIKDANADLVKQRETFEAKEKAWGAERTTLEGVKKDLETKLADAQKGGTQMDPAVKRAYDEQIAALTKRLDESEAAKAKEVQDRRATELKNSIISAATKAINPNQVFALMQAEGLVGINEKGESFFYKRNDKGENVAQKPEEAVTAFLTANKHLENSSGTGGSGGNPTKPGAVAASGLMANPEAAL